GRKPQRAVHSRDSGRTDVRTEGVLAKRPGRRDLPDAACPLREPERLIRAERDARRFRIALRKQPAPILAQGRDSRNAVDAVDILRGPKIAVRIEGGADDRRAPDTNRRTRLLTRPRPSSEL